MFLIFPNTHMATSTLRFNLLATAFAVLCVYQASAVLDTVGGLEAFLR